MKKHETIITFGLVGFSVITSFLFVFYGMNIILSDQMARGVMVFAYVTTAYGLANITILSIAWSSREPWSETASKFISLCYLGVFVMDMINSGMKSQLGVVGIVVVAVALGMNWFTITKVIARE